MSCSSAERSSRRSTALVPTCQTTRSGCSATPVPAETGQFLRNILTAYPMIDDPDLDAGKPLPQFLLEAARIAQSRAARPNPEGRRGAHRDDRERLPGQDAG